MLPQDEGERIDGYSMRKALVTIADVSNLYCYYDPQHKSHSRICVLDARIRMHTYPEKNGQSTNFPHRSARQKKVGVRSVGDGWTRSAFELN